MRILRSFVEKEDGVVSCELGKLNLGVYVKKAYAEVLVELRLVRYEEDMLILRRYNEQTISRFLFLRNYE